MYRRQGSRPSPWKTKCKKAKWLPGEALQIAVKRREAKSKGKMERYKHLRRAVTKSGGTARAASMGEAQLGLQELGA